MQTLYVHLDLKQDATRVEDTVELQIIDIHSSFSSYLNLRARMPKNDSLTQTESPKNNTIQIAIKISIIAAQYQIGLLILCTLKHVP